MCARGGLLLFCAMHARTHGKKIPAFWRLGQDLGIFMQPKHHRAHHKAPFDCYFSFLQGFNVAYTELYNRLLMHNRTLMTVFFVALQPPVTKSAPSAETGPCSQYRVDLTGAVFGQCKCGFAKAKHAPSAFGRGK